MSTTVKPRPRTGQKERTEDDHDVHLGERLDHYTDPRGRERELVCRPGAGGSRLVIDRLARTFADQRLVAHLAADEPADNARLLASMYVADVDGRRCRRLTAEDFEFATEEMPAATEAEPELDAGGGELRDARGFLYRLAAVRNGRSIPELRWWRQAPEAGDLPRQVVSVREVIGSLQSYEPPRTLTAQALAGHHDPRVSTRALHAELDRICESSIVLNRGLREAVLAAIKERGLSLSEIAMRCGRIKRDEKGRESGETSWLARRIGVIPESGKNTPTPWVSSAVLALIARRGLGVSPREVEL